MVWYLSERRPVYLLISGAETSYRSATASACRQRVVHSPSRATEQTCHSLRCREWRILVLLHRSTTGSDGITFCWVSPACRTTSAGPTSSTRCRCTRPSRSWRTAAPPWRFTPWTTWTARSGQCCRILPWWLSQAHCACFTFYTAQTFLMSWNGWWEGAKKG